MSFFDLSLGDIGLILAVLGSVGVLLFESFWRKPGQDGSKDDADDN